MIFYDDSFIEWTAGPAASGERNLSFSITESPDVVSCTAAVIIGADVAITEAPDVVSVGLSHTVGATWTLEANGVIEWPQAWIEVGAAERNLAFAIMEAPDTVSMGMTVTVEADLAITEAPDTVSCTIAHVVGATWALEVEGILEWPQAWTAPPSPVREMIMAATEAADTVAASISIEVSASLAATESPDIFAGAATNEAPEVWEPKFSEYRRPWWNYPERAISVRVSEQPDRVSMHMTVTGISDQEMKDFIFAIMEMEEEEVLV